MPKPNKEIKQLLINDFGYEPVELESYTGQLRALKESFNTLQIEDPKDPRLKELAIAIKDLRAQREVEKDKTGKLKVTRKRRSDSKSAEQIKTEIDAKEQAKADRKAKKKKDAMNFISPGSAPSPVDQAGDAGGGGDMSSALMKISNDVNIIKGIVEAQKDISEDQADDTRKAREKKKRGMAENLLEGTKGAVKAVTGALGKVLSPVKGIFMQIFDFLTKFLLGAGLMKLLDWMGNPENKSKINSIFKFLKDYWPTLITALLAFVPGFPVLAGVIALAVGFLPKLINLIKSIFGFGKQVDKEIAKNEKTLEEGGEIKEDAKIKDEGGPEPVEGGQDDTGATVDAPDGAGEKPNVQPPQFNKGGEVPGSGNTDTVPAMLTPGEFVLTKDAVNNIGADTLYGLNAAAGGVGKPQDQPPPKKKKMKTSTVGTMMNMGGLKMGGMTNNAQYMSYGGPVQHMFLGGMVKKAGNFLAKTPQARLLRFAANQVKKLPVKPPVAKALKALKALGKTGKSSMPPMGGDSGDSINELPSFSVIAPGGRAKEQTLGIRR